MIRTYQYRIYPTPSQAALLDKMLEQAREIYNLVLTQCENEYETFKANAANGEKFKMNMPTTQYPYFAAWIKLPGILLTASAASQVLRRADKTYQNFFRDIKAGLRAKNGGPLQIRKRRYGEYDTLDFQYGHGATWKPNARYPERRVVRLTNVGDVKARMHRPLPEAISIKFIQITRKASGWYVNLQFETADKTISANGKPPTGIGLGFERLASLSDGNALTNPKWLRHELAHLRRLQRKFNRCQKNSLNRADQRLLVAKLHEKIARIRRDFWHNVVCDLCREYGLIVTLDSDMKPILEGKYTALPAYDAAFGIFKQILSYKAEALGSRWMAIQKKGVYRTCSGCGKESDTPVGKTFRCPACGLELERGHNAARNILKVALDELREAKQNTDDTEALANLTI